MAAPFAEIPISLARNSCVGLGNRLHNQNALTMESAYANSAEYFNLTVSMICMIPIFSAKRIESGRCEALVLPVLRP
jgi:hypothetical protein